MYYHLPNERMGPWLPFFGGLLVGGLVAGPVLNNHGNNFGPQMGPSYYQQPYPQYVPYPMQQAYAYDPTMIYVNNYPLQNEIPNIQDIPLTPYSN